MNLENTVFIFDLHNTIYDEVMEYGGAMDAAISVFLKAAKENKQELSPADLYAEITASHRMLGSDWDDDVFAQLPSLRQLPNTQAVLEQANKVRAETSATLTKRYAYTSTITALRQLASKGAAIYLATEATANAAADALRSLALDDGTIRAIYCWPYTKPYKKLAHTAVHDFPANPHEPSRSLEKPHPLIIAVVMLAEAKRRQLIASDIRLEDVYSFSIDDSIDVAQLAELAANVGGARKSQVDDALQAIRTHLAFRGNYKSIFDPLWKNAFYVGDSFFKDGFLARNAGLPFVFAKYGKYVRDDLRETHERAKHVLYAVTGWDKTLLKLTQEVERIPELVAAIKPFFECQESIDELLVALTSAGFNWRTT
jgi:phosphoglycolate phosphatase-like HAD superfamily hydrolase